MTARSWLVLGGCAVLASSSLAQTRRANPQEGRAASEGESAKPLVDRIGSAEIRRALSGVRPDAHWVVFPGSADGHAQYVLNRRRTPSDVERHGEWDDILVFQTGYGAVHHGGEWRNAKTIYLGEQRGGSLVAPTEVIVGPGDVVRVPAGEAHRVVPRGDAPLVYLVVKVRRQASKP